MDRPRRILAAGFALVAIFGIGLMFSGYVPFSLSLRPMEYGRDDGEFARTRIGDVLFATGQGNACRKVQFHNNTGRFGADMKVRCDTGLADDQTTSVLRPTGGDRLMSVRDAFVHR